MQSIIKQEFKAHLITSEATMEAIGDSLEATAKFCINCLNNGGKLIFFGNGGSAADAQHIAAELVGRYKGERKGLSAISLTTDTSILTCVSNDYGYDQVFVRQVEALANKNDVVIGISTGGTSANVVNALKLARKMGCKTIGLSGRGGGKFDDLCDANIVVPASDTPRIQEMHILIGHTICQLIDLEFT